MTASRGIRKNVAARYAPGETCRISGCSRPPGKGKNGYCYMHISRIRKTGSPGAPEPARMIGGSKADKLAFHGWVVAQSGCWEWSGPRNTAGYGFMCVDSTLVLAHRAAYEERSGSVIPAGKVVCHACDNPPCVRPDHLFLGEPADNLQDMHNKDRHARGARAKAAKLTDAQVLLIRALREEGVTCRDLSDQFGVRVRQIYKIINREQWKHLP